MQQGHLNPAGPKHRWTHRDCGSMYRPEQVWAWPGPSTDRVSEHSPIPSPEAISNWKPLTKDTSVLPTVSLCLQTTLEGRPHAQRRWQFWSLLSHHALSALLVGLFVLWVFVYTLFFSCSVFLCTFSVCECGRLGSYASCAFIRLFILFILSYSHLFYMILIIWLCFILLRIIIRYLFIFL